MKLLKKITAIIAACCICVSLTACHTESIEYFDNEEDPIRFSTLEVDGVFNPFFSSSATDSNVIGFTQLGMITNDEKGNPMCGEDQPTLALAMAEKMEGKKEGQVDNRVTTYYFVLKNNVKFSDGSPVTMKDVLFNLYVYLDMAYTGSSTIYSTDIIGLKEYRTQAATKTEQDAFMVEYENKANARTTALSERVGQIIKDHGDDSDFSLDKVEEYLQGYVDSGNAAYKHLVNDYKKLVELFKEELETDYSNSLNQYEDMEFKTNDGNLVKPFTTDTEVFLYNEGILEWHKKETNPDHRLTSKLATPAQVKTWDKDKAIQEVFEYNIPDKLDQVVNYWASGTNLFTYVTNEELEIGSASKEKKYKSIEGIKFANGGAERGGAESVTLPDGTVYNKPEYNADGSVKSGNEVLTIAIHGVDPKAIWNFSFAVAPMYYYSGTHNDVDYIQSFNYVDNFGVAWNSQSFMEKVVKNPDKIGVPVGAGPYMASKASGGTDGVTAGTFRDKGVIYYERNPHYLLGPATIKKLRLVVTSSTGMISSLASKNVDFAEPNAKPEAEDEVKKYDGLESQTIKTQGYGYIGINAGKIPDLEVRRAIMYCIDTQLCVDYYKSQAEQIHRSMSSESEFYPKGATAYYPYIGGPVPENLNVVDPYYKNFVTKKGKKAGQTLSEDQQREFIETLLEDAGFSKNSNDIYYKGSHTCEYTFTIAGESNDHPAWIALYNAGKKLDGYGFKVTVKTDANALKKLTSGALTVWAAAWSSTIDPDMYQVYHKDSTATSVLNWGYPQIIRNDGGKYDREVEILDELSRQIENGRNYTAKDDRKPIYSYALDLLMQLAVELPTYQRDDMYAYNYKRIDTSTFFQNATSLKGLTGDIEKVSLIVEK